MATDANVSDSVKLAAIRDALDRAGLNPKAAVEIGVSLRPYEQILDDLVSIESSSRAEWRRRQGIPDDSENYPPPALADRPRERPDMTPQQIWDWNRYYPLVLASVLAR
jgi:hypothetical protein